MESPAHIGKHRLGRRKRIFTGIAHQHIQSGHAGAQALIWAFGLITDRPLSTHLNTSGSKIIEHIIASQGRAQNKASSSTPPFSGPLRPFLQNSAFEIHPGPRYSRKSLSSSPQFAPGSPELREISFPVRIILPPPSQYDLKAGFFHGARGDHPRQPLIHDDPISGGRKFRSGDPSTHK